MSVFQCFSIAISGKKMEKVRRQTSVTRRCTGDFSVTRHGFSEDGGCQNCLRVSERGVGVSLSD